MIVNPQTLNRRIIRVGELILKTNPYLLWAILLVIVMGKNGLRTASGGISAGFIPALESMPYASVPAQSGPAPFFLAWILGISSAQAWVVMTSVVFLLALVMVVPLVKRQESQNTQLSIVMLAALPVISTQLSWLGMYDPFIFLGVLVWFFSRTKLMWFIGALIAASGNPEQLVVAASCAFLLSCTSSFTKYRFKTLILLSTAVLVWVLSQIWFMASSNDENRFGLISELLDPSIYAFAKYWPNYIWAIYGSLWLVVLLLLLSRRSRLDGLIFFLFAIVLPLGFSAITLDGARVLALVTLPMALIFIQSISENYQCHRRPSRLIAVVIVLLIVIAPLAENGWTAIGPLLVDQLPWFPTSEHLK